MEKPLKISKNQKTTAKNIEISSKMSRKLEKTVQKLQKQGKTFKYIEKLSKL